VSVVRVVDSSVIGASYYSIDCGGEGIREYVKDMSYIGGNTNCWSGCIDFTHESAIRDHAPQEVYLRERWGEYRYTLSGLEGGKRYKLRLHFIKTTPQMCVQTYGSTNRRDVRVDTREEVSPGPEELYKTERWGEYSYTLSNSTLGLEENISFWYYDDTTKTSIPDYDNNFGTIRALQGYLIRFHFAETYFTRVGERVFDVYVNNRIAFKDLDIIHQTGGKNRALIKEYFAAADSMGKIVIDFKKGKADYPTCSGIEIIRWHSGRDGDYLLEVWPNMVRVNDTVQLNAKVYDGAGYMVPEERVEILGWQYFIGKDTITENGILITKDIQRNFPDTTKGILKTRLYPRLDTLQYYFSVIIYK